MGILIVGVSHKKTPIQIREKFYCTEVEQELLLSELKSNCSIVEAIVLSTCNRTEIFASVLDEAKDTEAILKKLFEIKGLEWSRRLLESFYFFHGKEAIEHLLKVTTGLDSLVLGEKQILGQVKEAVKRSRKKAMIGKEFNILSNIAIRAGKKAQNETDISCGGMSISWAAVTMAEKMVGSLEGKSVLIMGAGKMSELAGDLLRSRNASKVYVMNRTRKNAEELAKKFNGIPVGFWDILDILGEVDVGICAVDAPHYVLEKETVVKALRARQGRELFLIDISIPRNIDPLVHEVPGAHLVHIDELDKVVQKNMKKREKAIFLVEEIIEDKLNGFYSKMEKIEKLGIQESLNVSFRI